MEDVTFLQWLFIAFVFCFPVGFLLHDARKVSSVKKKPNYASIPFSLLLFFLIIMQFIEVLYSEGKDFYMLFLHLSLLAALSMVFTLTMQDFLALTRIAQRDNSVDGDKKNSDTEVI